jgi:large subunit ribosomal protein L35
MPKMKTHRGTVKRFKITGSGKIGRRKQGGNHLRRKKTKRTKRTYSQILPVSDADDRRIKRILSAR